MGATSYQTNAEKEEWAWVWMVKEKNWKKVHEANWRHPLGPNIDLGDLENCRWYQLISMMPGLIASDLICKSLLNYQMGITFDCLAKSSGRKQHVDWMVTYGLGVIALNLSFVTSMRANLTL